MVDNDSKARSMDYVSNKSRESIISVIGAGIFTFAKLCDSAFLVWNSSIRTLEDTDKYIP